jgi:hypothetical protein
VILLALVGTAVYVFMPRKTTKFDVIEYIGYEAMALEEDPDGRLNLPSSDLEEIKQFVSTVPGLNFRPTILRPSLVIAARRSWQSWRGSGLRNKCKGNLNALS